MIAKKMEASTEQLNQIFIRMRDLLHEPCNQIEAILQNQSNSKSQTVVEQKPFNNEFFLESKMSKIVSV
jgi:hypothetical protein